MAEEARLIQEAEQRQRDLKARTTVKDNNIKDRHKMFNSSRGGEASEKVVAEAEAETGAQMALALSHSHLIGSSVRMH